MWKWIICILNKYSVQIFIIAIIITPIIINCGIRQPASFEFVGKDTDWLDFWVTYISAIASFAMVLITWRTLKQNDKLLQQNEDQLNELKRQWDEENRPRLEFYFVKNEILSKGEFIEILNIGKRVAYDIKIYLDESVIALASNEEIKSSLNNIGNSCSLLLHYESFIICLCKSKIGDKMKPEYTIGHEVVEENEYNKFQKAISSMKSISITGKYNDKYKISTKIYPNIKKNRYKEVSTTISEIRDAINMETYNMTEKGITVRIKQDANE